MNTFSKSLLSLASIIGAFTVMHYDGITKFSTRIENGAYRAQYRTIYTSKLDGTFYNYSYDAAIKNTDVNYYPGFLCQSKRDVSKCRSSYKW